MLVTAEAANSYKKYNCLCFNYLSPVMDSTDPNHHSSFNSNTRDEDKDIFNNHTKYKQWRSQEFRLGGARLKDKIGNKKLI